jgi:hypothetical protein
VYLQNMYSPPVPTASPKPAVTYTPPAVASSPAPPNYGQKSLQMKQSMTEEQVTALLGSPSKAELRTCGSKTASPWQCKIWTYGTYMGGMSVTFSQSHNGDWNVNDWSVY